MSELPSISSYGQYSSDNYGAHALRVDMPGLTVWFSYRTPVAFQKAGRLRVVRCNSWGPTTGKHLNWIDGGGSKVKDRVSSEEFERLFDEQVRADCGNQPKTGEPCHCKPGIERDNCPDCEGTGMRIDFAAIRAR